MALIIIKCFINLTWLTYYTNLSIYYLLIWWLSMKLFLNRINKKGNKKNKSITLKSTSNQAFISFHPLMKFLKLVDPLSLNPSTFMDDEHYQSVWSIHHMSHLVYHDICTRLSTSNTNPNRIIWTVSSSMSMEYPVDFHRILPSKKEYHHQDLLRKVTRWKASLWKIVLFVHSTFRKPMKTHKNDLCRQVCWEFLILSDDQWLLWNPTDSQYLQLLSTNEEQFIVIDYHRFKLQFSNQLICLHFPMWVLSFHIFEFNFLNPYQWHEDYFCTFLPFLSNIRKIFLMGILNCTKVRHHHWVHNTIVTYWCDCLKWPLIHFGW